MRVDTTRVPPPKPEAPEASARRRQRLAKLVALTACDCDPSSLPINASTPSVERPASATVDELVQALEARGLGWSLDNTGRLVEARVWDWPNVIGRYRPDAVEPLAKMLAKAMYQVDWSRYPER